MRIKCYANVIYAAANLPKAWTNNFFVDLTILAFWISAF